MSGFCTDPNHHDHSCPGYALERIADTLDDFMDMSLSLQGIARTMATEPEKALAAISDNLAAIAERRKNR